MTFVPIASDSDIIDQSKFEVPAPTPRVEGFFGRMMALMMTQPMMQGEYAKLRTWREIEGHGKHLTGEQVKALYPAAYDKYKNGGNEDDIKFDNSVISAQDEANAMANQMKPGLLSDATNLAGSIAGLSLSPTSLALGVGAAKAGQFAEEAMLGKDIMQNVIARGITKAAVGGIEGGSIGALPAASEAAYKASIGRPEEHPWLNVGKNFVYGAMLGGALKTAFGYKNIIDPDHAAYATQSAYEQLNSGKKVNVEPILKQGVYKASKEWTESPEEIGQAMIELDAKNVALNKEYSNARQIEKEYIIGFNEDQKADYEDMRKAQSFEDYKSIRESRRLVDAKDNEISELSDTVNDEELRTRYNEAKKLFNRSKDLESKIADNQELLDNTATYLNLVTNKPEPLTKDELVQAVNDQHQVQSNMDFNKSEEEQAQTLLDQKDPKVFQDGDLDDEQLNKFLDNHNKVLDNSIKELKNADALTNEDQDAIDAANEEQARHDTLSKSLRKYFYCVTKGVAA